MRQKTALLNEEIKKNEIIYINKIIKFHKNKKNKNIYNCISKNIKTL